MRQFKSDKVKSKMPKFLNYLLKKSIVLTDFQHYFITICIFHAYSFCISQVNYLGVILCFLLHAYVVLIQRVFLFYLHIWTNMDGYELIVYISNENSKMLYNLPEKVLQSNLNRIKLGSIKLHHIVISISFHFQIG